MPFARSRKEAGGERDPGQGFWQYWPRVRDSRQKDGQSFGEPQLSWDSKPLGAPPSPPDFSARPGVRGSPGSRLPPPGPAPAVIPVRSATGPRFRGNTSSLLKPGGGQAPAAFPVETRVFVPRGTRVGRAWPGPRAGGLSRSTYLAEGPGALGNPGG